MNGYETVLSALRIQANNIVGTAQGEAERARLRKEYAECVLRNRAKLIQARLQQTGDEAKRRRILRQSLLLGA
jgi:hypothetical protein